MHACITDILTSVMSLDEKEVHISGRSVLSRIFHLYLCNDSRVFTREDS